MIGEITWRYDYVSAGDGGGTKASAYIELVNECVCELDRAKAKVCSAVRVCVCVCSVCVCSVCGVVWCGGVG